LERERECEDLFAQHGRSLWPCYASVNNRF